jgi:transcriptional regulator with XRE-family HTH domain
MAKKPRKQHRPTFLRQWRKHRGLTLERLAARVGMVPSALSMLERGESGYSQPVLEALAEALDTSPASLLMRDPSDDNAMWSIWDQAAPGEKREISAVVEALIRTRRTGTKG